MEIQNERLRHIALKAANDLVQLVAEGEEKLLAAMAQAAAQAQDNESACKFKLGFGITLDLDENTQLNELNWSVRQKLSIACEIGQGDLFEAVEGEGSVTISTPGMKPVTMTPKQFHKAAQKLGGAN